MRGVEGGPTEPSQILDTPQRSLPIRHRRIEIILFPRMIHAEALKGQIPSGPIMRLHGPRQEQRAFHAQIFHPILHHAQFQRDHTRDLDRAAEADLPVALAEMQVADTEFRAFDVDREEDFAASRQVLDVAVPAVFGAPGHGAGSFFPNFLFYVLGGAAGMHIHGLRRESNLSTGIGERGYELRFAAVPFRKNLGGGRAAEDAGVNVAREADVRDVA